MRFTRITTTLLATSLMAGIAFMPQTTYGAEAGARRAQAKAEAQRHREEAEHNAVVAGLNLTLQGFSDPLAVLNAAAAPGNLTHALATAVAAPAAGAVGSVVSGQPIATIPEKLTVMRNIEVAAIVGASPATIAAKENIRKALGLSHNGAAIAGGSNESLAINRFIENARAAHILKEIETKMAAGTVDQIRQHIAAPGGGAAGGKIPAYAFPAHPTPAQIMKAFVEDINVTVQEAVANGVHPNNAQIRAWLGQFDVP